MLADFLEKLRKYAADANNPYRLDVHGVEGKTYFALKGGEIKSFEHTAPKRSAALEDVESFCSYLLTEGDGPAVFSTGNGPIAYLNADDRTEEARLGLLETDIYQSVCKLAGQPRSFDVKALVLALRFEFAGCVDESLETVFSRIDFERKSSGRRTVEHGNESLGRSVEANVQQRDDVPRSITMKFKLFRNGGLTDISAEVKVGVYIDVDAEKIVLHVMPDEMANVRNRAQVKIQQALVEALEGSDPEIPVYLGWA